MFKPISSECSFAPVIDPLVDLQLPPPFERSDGSKKSQKTRARREKAQLCKLAQKEMQRGRLHAGARVEIIAAFESDDRDVFPDWTPLAFLVGDVATIYVVHHTGHLRLSGLRDGRCHLIAPANFDKLRVLDTPLAQPKVPGEVVLPRFSTLAKDESTVASAAVSNLCNVVIDCEFGPVLSEKEVSLLVRQLMRCYGANKKAAFPVHLHLTGLEGPTLKSLQRVAGFTSWNLTAEVRPYCEIFPKSRLVYLTAEASQELNEFDPEDVYIIGGIVDHNRLKGATARKAILHGLRMARLPLDRHVEMGSVSRVLTVNCVFEMLLVQVATGDWQATVDQCLPRRKNFGQLLSRKDDFLPEDRC